MGRTAQQGSLEGFGVNGGWRLGRIANQGGVRLQGLLGVNVAEDLGGVGGSFLDEMIVSEELAYRWLDRYKL